MTRAQLVASRIALWNQQNTHAALDADAVLAVAAREGLGGGVGDNGTSFGPFQLHQGGALPHGIPLDKAHDWAWSPAGIDYALSHIATVAGGLKGQQAVTNIVRRFERPANPDAEIAGALGHPVTANYGGTTAKAPTTVAQAAPDLTALLALMPTQVQAQPFKLPTVSLPDIPVGGRAKVTPLDLLTGLR